MSLRTKYVSLITLFLFASCGSNPTLEINLTGAAAFADATVTDIVFTFQNVPTEAGGLDQDKDGVADAFVYPSACGAPKPAGCGFPATTGQITVGDLPLGFQYTVVVELRNATGTVLYDSSEVTFNNDEGAAAVTVNVD